jgi:hypothetical protein
MKVIQGFSGERDRCIQESIVAALDPASAERIDRSCNQEEDETDASEVGPVHIRRDPGNV